MEYSGANGLTVSEITQLSLTEKHSAASPNPNRIGVPYLRIFTDNGTPGDGSDDHSIIFDATECATVDPDEDVFVTFDVLAATPSGEFRYDDDACGAAAEHLTWAQVLAAHGDEVISGIFITTGFTGGSDLVALLRELSVNGEAFTFGSA